MSIIYEALKKTQDNRQTIHKEVVIPRNNKTLMILLLMFGILISAFFVYEKFGVTGENSTKSMKQVALNKEHPAIQISGTFLSDKIRMAMINHELYHVGDTVGDLKIIGIESDKVEFRNDKGDVAVKVTA